MRLSLPSIDELIDQAEIAIFVLEEIHTYIKFLNKKNYFTQSMDAYTDREDLANHFYKLLEGVQNISPKKNKGD